MGPAGGDVSRRGTSRKPRIGSSACLEVEACRYNGHAISDRFVDRLFDHVRVVPVCPEVAIGLGVPRDPVRLVVEEGETRLVQPSTERDLTDEMREFADGFVEQVPPLDGFVLKSGSPSCDPEGTSIYKPNGEHGGRSEPGMFARVVEERLDGVAIEHEGRLRNYRIRHHFLIRLFSYADLRELMDEPSMARLTDFHRRHKHLLMAYDRASLDRLGRLAANPDDTERDEVFGTYAEIFRDALAEPPSRGAMIDALMHMYGHFKEELSDAERDDFLEKLEDVRAHRLPMMAVASLLHSWANRFEYDYLVDQSLLQPYPKHLVVMRDSGKGIDF